MFLTSAAGVWLNRCSKTTHMFIYCKWNMGSVKRSNELHHSLKLFSVSCFFIFYFFFFLFCFKFIVELAINNSLLVTALFPCSTSCQKAQLLSRRSSDLLQLIYGSGDAEGGRRKQKEKETNGETVWMNKAWSLVSFLPVCLLGSGSGSVVCRPPRPPVPQHPVITLYDLLHSKCYINLVILSDYNPPTDT